MRASIVLAAAAASTVLAQAPITNDNPGMTSIQATLQASKDVQGSITGVSNNNGTGVNFNVNFYSFPSTGGPFTYYIASTAAPTSNDCSTLTTIFNPYTATGTCKAVDPADCAVGALSAKHGAITGATPDTSFQRFYLDLYLSTFPSDEAYFGGHAVVVADKSGKPLNCANFPGTPVAGIGGSASSSAASSSVAAATSSMAAASSSASGSASSASASAAAATSSAAAVANKVGVGAGAGAGAALVAALAVLVV